MKLENRKVMNSVELLFNDSDEESLTENKIKKGGKETSQEQKTEDPIAE